MQGQFPSNGIRDAFCKKNAGVYLYVWYFQLWNPPLQSCFLALLFSRVPFLLFIISNRLSTVFMGAVMNGKLECSELTIVLLSFFRSDKWCFAFSISSLPQEPDRMCACVFVSVWFWAECYFSFYKLCLALLSEKEAGLFWPPDVCQQVTLRFWTSVCLFLGGGASVICSFAFAVCDVHTALSLIVLITMVCDLSCGRWASHLWALTER